MNIFRANTDKRLMKTGQEAAPLRRLQEARGNCDVQVALAWKNHDKLATTALVVED